MRATRKIFLATLALAAAARSLFAVLPVSVTGFSPGLWGLPDATLGIAGYTIATFETTSLPSGVLIGWNTTAGNVTPASTIPSLFDATVADPNGNAFVNGQWDGSYGLINTRTNQTFAYNGASQNWGNIVINFPTPVSSVGFSLQQNEFDVTVLINGSSIGTLQSRTTLVPDGGRYGYFRIDGNSGFQITSLELVNLHGDGIMIDHLAFAPIAIPEPANAAALFALVVALRAWRQRKETLT